MIDGGYEAGARHRFRAHAQTDAEAIFVTRVHLEDRRLQAIKRDVVSLCRHLALSIVQPRREHLSRRPLTPPSSRDGSRTLRAARRTPKCFEAQLNW